MLSQENVEYLSCDRLIHSKFKVFAGTAFDAKGCGCKALTRKWIYWISKAVPRREKESKDALSKKGGTKNS